MWPLHDMLLWVVLPVIWSANQIATLPPIVVKNYNIDILHCTPIFMISG